MTVPSVSARTRHILVLCLIAVLAVLYGMAWMRPEIGLDYRDGAALTAGRALIHGDGYRLGTPPLFPALLGLMSLVSTQPQWLKLLPLICTLLWLALANRLLRRMGASQECALLLCVAVAASPLVLHLSTGLFPEPLLGLLATGALVAFLEERYLAAGILSGLATLTVASAFALIPACVLTLMVYRRLRSAALYVAPAILLSAPWFGWALASGTTVFPLLPASDKVNVLATNTMLLAAAPFAVLTGNANLYPGFLTVIGIILVLIRQRRFVPDLFLGLFCLFLLFYAGLPTASFAPLVPLFLWMLWRELRKTQFAMLVRIALLALMGWALWNNVRPLPPTDNWRDMQTLFTWIRTQTPADAVVLADLDPIFAMNTQRRTVRGFPTDEFRRNYTPQLVLVTPDALEASILHNHISIVALTPDRGVPESKSFHESVEALERGGLLEAIAVPDAPPDYRLLRVLSLQRKRP